MSVKNGLQRNHEMYRNGFALNTLIISSDTGSYFDITEDQALLFCDLHFSNRYYICPEISWNMVSNAAGRFCSFWIFQLLHSLMLSFMPLLRFSWKNQTNQTKNRQTTTTKEKHPTKPVALCTRCLLHDIWPSWRLSQIFLTTTTSVLCDHGHIA